MKYILYYLVLLILVNIAALEERGRPGGEFEVSKPYGEDYKEYAEFAASKLTETLQSPYQLKVIDISDITKQVVEGMLYRMTLKLAPTMCEVSGQNSDDCRLQDCYTPIVCDVTVWDRPWLKDQSEKRKLTESNCKQEEETC